MSDAKHTPGPWRIVGEIGAAAPELLVALREIANEPNDYGSDGEFAEALQAVARNAIAKAEKGTE